jgi:OmpA-OmpF porin, OOP family
MPHKPLFLAWFMAFALVSPAHAQELSVEEYQALFQTEMEAFREARDSPDLGRARGLVLAPLREEAEAISVEATPTSAAAPTLADEDAPPAAHWVLPADLAATMRVTFAFDSAVIAEGEKPKLRQICAAIEGANVGLLRVVGHTDSVGAASYNERLSMRRAEAVQRFFVDDCRIPAERFEAMGVGMQFPANAADPAAAENRRVEFQALS